MVRRGLLGAVVALAALGPALAAQPVDQLRQFLSQTHSASGDFTQQNPAPRGPGGAPARGAPQVLRGSFEFLRPGLFRWSVQVPYEQLVVSDGQHLYLYDRDLNQVTRKNLAGALPASPASILFGSNDFEHDFTIENDGSSDGIDWIRATPRGKDSLFERIRIGFQGALPVAMELRDSFGQSTQLAFDHAQRNPALAREHFRFIAPPGADVLEEK